MNQVEVQVRRALQELADEGRPVPLGRRALAHVRRRRQHRAMALAAITAVVVATMAAPRLLGGDGRPEQPVPDLTGRNLVAAYFTTTEVRVLSPATGQYRTTELSVETVSADMHFAAGIRPSGFAQTYPAEDPRLGVLDTRTGDLEWLGLPHPIKEPAWSPGGGYVIARVADNESARAVLIEPAQDKATVIPLRLPADRFLVRLCWSDAEQLLAVTLPLAGVSGSVTQDLVVLDRSGALVRTVSIPLSWSVHCAGRQGQVLATRLARSGSAATVVPPEAVIIDLTTGTVGTPVRLPWAGAIEPLAWRSDHSFVAAGLREVLIVDLGLGTVVKARDVPGHDFSSSVIVSTEWLDRYPDAVAKAAF